MIAHSITDDGSEFSRAARFGREGALHRIRLYGNAVATRNRLAALLTVVPDNQVAELTAALAEAEAEVTAARTIAGVDAPEPEAPR